MAQLSPEDKLALLRQHEDGVPWTRVVAGSGVALRTLSRWSGKYQADPSSRGLKRSDRADRGTRRFSGELVETIEALALQKPEPTAAFIYRRVGDIARQRGLSSPSYSTVRAIIAAIDPGLRTLAHQGQAAYRDKFELVFRRTAARPNEQWQADHTLLDKAGRPSAAVVDRGAGARGHPPVPQQWPCDYFRRSESPRSRTLQ